MRGMILNLLCVLTISNSLNIHPFVAKEFRSVASSAFRATRAPLCNVPKQTQPGAVVRQTAFPGNRTLLIFGNQNPAYVILK